MTEIFFCDLCNESVPLSDLDGGRAFRIKGRVVCATCNLTMTIAGGPVVLGPPRETIYCVGGEATMTVAAAGDGLLYLWQRFDEDDQVWEDLFDQTYDDGSIAMGTHTATLHVSNLARTAAGLFRVLVSNACGSVTTPSAPLHLCSSDFNCDGLVESQDFELFVVAYDEVLVPPAEARFDINEDGVVELDAGALGQLARCLVQ